MEKKKRRENKTYGSQFEFGNKKTIVNWKPKLTWFFVFKS